MGDFRVAVIDGTGAWRNATYASEMQHSFCSQIAAGARPDSQYWRGPSWDGLRVHSEATTAAAWLSDQRRGSRQAVRLFMAGYSRGASAAIMAAERLTAQGIWVDGLFLFDPVARHVFPGGEVIPSKVRFVRVARRSLDPGLVQAHEKNALTAHLPVSNPMRPWFGTTGLSYQGDGDFKSKEFRGSHGALGGVGWRKLGDLDAGCQQEVANWMTEALKSQGLMIDLVAFPPSS